ncbi:MAG: hypothetical protein GOV02_02520 [Candidatus Aenigmarchaeota archaeon]|nr:hypothetical protein [Candidatus Aenigmarchaeota archaeon]
MTFYKPIIMDNRRTPLIIYPEFGIETVLKENGEPILDRNEISAIKNYISNLIGTESAGPAGRMTIDWSQKCYMVSFLWENSGELFYDFWKMHYGWDSGPLAFPFIIGNNHQSLDKIYENNKNIGIGSGNTLIVLGQEEIHRRKIENEISKHYLNLTEEGLRDNVNKEYFDENNRPEVPFELVSDESFYIFKE